MARSLWGRCAWAVHPCSPVLNCACTERGLFGPGFLTWLLNAPYLKRPCRCAASSCAVQRRLSRDLDLSERRQVGRLEPAAGVSTASGAGCLARSRNFPNVFSSSSRRGPSSGSGNGLPPQIQVMSHHHHCWLSISNNHNNNTRPLGCVSPRPSHR